MVRTETKTVPMLDLYQRNTDSDWNTGSEGISISSSFQRGDEETGIWTSEFKQHYIDSLQKGYPSGILTFVKDHISATAYQNPWKVLDGGNRLRAIRDYIDDRFVDLNGNSFSHLTERSRARFEMILIPCQEITIERTDSNQTIADMFIRLNTKTNPLRHGELIKAYGHRGDVWEIEMAKKLIGDQWTTDFNDNYKLYGRIDLQQIRQSWSETFAEIRETTRCDSLAMILGYIVSAKTSNFTLFDKRYVKLAPTLSKAGDSPTPTEYELIYGKLAALLNVVSKITDKSIMGTITRGIPPQTKTAPIWKKICEGTFTAQDANKMITFYNSLTDNIELKAQYTDLFKGSNSETGNAKIQKIVDFVLADHH
jgi:hypothetical protein